MAASAPTPSATKGPSPGGGGSLNYNGIRLNGLSDVGQFRTVNEKFGWRLVKAAVKSEAPKTIQYDGTQTVSALWFCTAPKEFQVKVAMQDGDIVRFDGFKETDFASLQRHMKQHWNIELTKAKLGTKGWNWGEGKVEGKHFDFLVDGRVGFQFPVEKVGQVSASKGDVTLVVENDDSRAEVEDQLLELRLFVPPPKSGDEDPADALKEAFLSIVGTAASSTQGICTISDVKVLVPAGRYDLVISRQSMKLQGKSNDFTIDFSNITKMYLLHSGSSPHMNVVVSLNSPLRKGRTVYHNVVILFDDKKVVDVELALTQEQISEIEAENPSTLDTHLETKMSGVVYDLTARIVKCLSGKQMLVPGDFRSANGLPCFRSSYKADSGNFYPLNQSFVFIPKPVIIIKYEEIATVSFGRTSGSQTKLFEFDVIVKGGTTYSFSSVDRQESGPFMEFLSNRNIRVRSFTPDEANEPERQSGHGIPSDDEESEDEDFQAGESSEDDSFDEDDEDDDDEPEDEEKTKKAKEDAENKKPKKRRHSDSGKSPTKKHKGVKPKESPNSKATKRSPSKPKA